MPSGPKLCKGGAGVIVFLGGGPVLLTVPESVMPAYEIKQVAKCTVRWGQLSVLRSASAKSVPHKPHRTAASPTAKVVSIEIPIENSIPRRGPPKMTYATMK